ncbi:MAG: CRISPR-associated protein, Csm1 family, partial [bacterium 42_11]
DYLSAGERRGDAEKGSGYYYKEPLLSVFSQVFDGGEGKYYPLEKLCIEEDIVFPREKEEYSYDKLEEGFESDLKAIETEEDLLALLERYLWCVPSQVEKATPDISLYDHSRVTAAIAVAYWHEIRAKESYGEDFWKGRLRDVRELLLRGGNGRIGEEADFLLVGGDLSGIQSFIFDIPSKGAAKSLKGRSLFLSLLMEVVARYIIRKLDLRLVNTLYIGGGTFWILAPRSAENKLEEIKREISKNLLKALKGKVYISLAWIPLFYKYFFMKHEENFAKAVELLQEKLSKVKMAKFKEVFEIEGGYELLFGSPGELASYEEHCVICGENERRLLLDYDEPPATQKICKMCNSFIELSQRFGDKNYIGFKEIEPGPETEIEDCFSLFKAFGYSIEAFRLEDDDRRKRIYLENALLKKPKETFEELSKRSEGDDLLGYVKLDVDSLGRLFKEGLGENYSISRVAALSRMLALFFERYVPRKIISDTDYLVFAGGDDALIISPWNRALEIAKVIEEAFRRYVASNPNITFSVGIFLAKPHYPVSRAAETVEEELHRAKSKYVEKNGVAIWGEVFTKKEYEAVLKLWEELKGNFKKAELSEARASLFRVIAFAREIRETGESFRFPRPWLFVYALRNMKDKDFRDYLVGLYERLPFKGKVKIGGIPVEVRNPAILYIASCLAYLSTREVR